MQNFCLAVLYCSLSMIAILLCLTNRRLKHQLIHQLKKWWCLGKNADCFSFLLNCALLFGNHSSIFFPYMQMKISSKAIIFLWLWYFEQRKHLVFLNPRLILLDYPQSKSAFTLRQAEEHRPLQSRRLIAVTSTRESRLSHFGLIARYLFFMMPDRVPADLIRLAWHMNKHIRLSSVTTGMLLSQQ